MQRVFKGLILCHGLLGPDSENEDWVQASLWKIYVAMVGYMKGHQITILTICFPVQYTGGRRLFKPRWPLGSLGIVASFTWMQNVTLKFNTVHLLIRQLVTLSISDFLGCPMAPDQAYFLLGNNIQKCLIPAMLCPPQGSQLGKPSKRWTIDFFSEQKKWTSSFQGIVMVWWNKWYSVYNPGR